MDFICLWLCTGSALSRFGSVTSGPRSSHGSCEYSVQVFYWLYINVQDETDKLQLSGLGIAAILCSGSSAAHAGQPVRSRMSDNSWKPAQFRWRPVYWIRTCVWDTPITSHVSRPLRRFSPPGSKSIIHIISPLHDVSPVGGGRICLSLAKEMDRLFGHLRDFGLFQCPPHLASGPWHCSLRPTS